MAAKPLPKICLVEDYAADAMLLKISVRRTSAPIELCVETTGEAALARLAAEPVETFRLVVIDINLPRLSGFEVLKRLRAEPGTAALVVIMMTSSTAPNDVEKAYTLGADAYLVKPFESKAYETVALALAEACDSLARLETCEGKHHFIPRPVR